MEALSRQIRLAARSLARSPGLTLAVVLTLGLAIGADSAVFSAIDAILLRPLPFPEGDRLVQVVELDEKGTEKGIAPVRLEDWNRLVSTLRGLTGYYTEDVSEVSGELPERVRRAMVSPRFLSVLGVAPALGRDFTAEELRFGGPPAVLISDRFWRRRFAAGRDVLGAEIRLGSGSAYSVVGVLPATFRFVDRDVDLWFPLPPDVPFARDRSLAWFQGIGRLGPGATPSTAQADLAAAQAVLAGEFPDSDRDVGVRVSALKGAVVGDVGATLWLVFGAVTVLLLIACTNIAALLLARAQRRASDVSIRLALGASRGSIAAQTLVETSLLALAGTGLGLLLAAGLMRLIRSLTASLPRADEVVLDGRILAYTTACALAVTFLCGSLPALRSARGSFASHESTLRGQVSGRHRAQWLLVGTQVALAVALLADAALLTRSFRALGRVDPGFEPAGVLSFQVSSSFAETTDREALALRIERTLAAMRSLPGVTAAAATTWLPGVPSQLGEELERIEGAADPDASTRVDSRWVSPAYFDLLRVPLVAGELCDSAAARPGAGTGEAMVNRSFAERHFPASSPVGRTLSSGSGATARIRGVVADAREEGLERAVGPTVYWCDGGSWPWPYFLIRTAGEPGALVPVVRRTLAELEPLRSVYNVAPLEQRLGEVVAEDTLRTVVLVAFGTTAMLLACIGLYATLSYITGLHRREVGLRLAIGARRSDVVRQFVFKGLRVVAPACLAGVALAAASARALSGMLYGVSASDPLTLTVVVVVALTVCTLAALLPATRAALADPMQTLRDE